MEKSQLREKLLELEALLDDALHTGGQQRTIAISNARKLVKELLIKYKEGKK